jgi:hypothetical protein
MLGVAFESSESDHSTIRIFVPSLPLPDSNSKRARALDEDRAGASSWPLATVVEIPSGSKSSLRGDGTAIVADLRASFREAGREEYEAVRRWHCETDGLQATLGIMDQDPWDNECGSIASRAQIKCLKLTARLLAARKERLKIGHSSFVILSNEK